MENFNLPYISILLIYTVLFCFEYKIKGGKRARPVIRGLCVVIYIFFWGFRGLIGTDWYNYEIAYSLSSWDEWLFTDYEVGFSAIMKTFKLLDLTYFDFVFFITFIQAILFDRLCAIYAPQISLPYILLIALFPVVVIDLLRNFTAILIVANGLELLRNNRNFKFIFIMLLAMAFHLSAIVYFSLFFLRKSIINKRILVVLLPLGIVIYLLQIDFYKQFLATIGSALGGGYEDLINQAVGEEEVSYGLSFGIIEKVLLFCGLILIYKKLKGYNPLIINACFIYILIYLFFSTSQSFINRFSALFFWGYILTYAYLININKRMLGGSILAMVLLAFCLIRTYVGYNNILYSYKNVIFEQENMTERESNRSLFYKTR